MKTKLIATIALAAVFSAGAMGIAACKPEENKTDVNPEIYAIYTAYAESEGESALTYEEWYAQLLAMAKGAKGDKGDKGDTGATGAQGPAGANGTNGKSAYEIWLEQEGNEGKSVEEFLASLKGADGAQGPAGANGTNGTNGKNGTNGNSITHGVGKPEWDGEHRQDGDMYIDTSTWDVYFYQFPEWIYYGSIKGKDGKNGKDAGVEENTWTYELDFTNAGQVTMPIVDMPEGAYIMEIDLNTETANYGSNGLNAYVDNTSNRYTYFVRSEAKSSPDHNVYQACLYLKSDSQKIVFGYGPRVKTSVTIKEYSMPTLKADGNEVEVPANIAYNLFGNVDLKTTDSVFKFKIDDSVEAGDYTLKLTPDGKQAGYRVYIEGTSQTMRQSNFSGKTFTYNATDRIAYCHLNSSSDTLEWQYVHFVKISLTPAEAV